MSDDQLIEAFDECVRAMEAGASLEAAVARYPRLAADLRPMLLAVQAAKPSQPVRVPRQSEEASHARFLARARELRRARNRGVGGWWSQLSLVPRLALAVLVVALGGFGVVSASAASLPGDALYGVKRTVEQAQLSFTPAEQRPALEAAFNQRRVDEVQALIQQGRETPTPVSFRGLVELQGEPWWVIGGIRVVVAQPSLGEYPNGIGKLAEVIGELRADGLVYGSVTIIDADLPPQPTTPSPTATSQSGVTVTSAPEVTNTQELRTPEPTRTQASGGSGPSPSNTPEPSETQGSGPSPSNTPKPSSTPGSGGSGPSPSNTPRPPNTPTVPSPSETPDDDETDEPEVEFEGILQSTNPWTVNGQVFTVNAETEFRNNPQVGDNVEVKAYRLNDGTLLARRIEKK